MNVINSLEKISNKLEEIGFDKEPGSILYSGNETLSKGNFYFLGLNPGGNTNLSVSEDTVINQLKKKDSTFNEYFQGVWKERGKQPTPPGQSILQQRIKILFSRLRVDLRKTCSSNLVFVRSPVLSELHLDWEEAAEKCWEIHKIMLSTVQPKILLVFGDEARDFIQKKMVVIDREFFELESQNKDYIFGCIKGSIPIDDLTSLEQVSLISTPHLRRFKIDAKGWETNSAYDTRPAIEWMDEKIQERLGLFV